jgi:hypothetical protein
VLKRLKRGERPKDGPERERSESSSDFKIVKVTTHHLRQGDDSVAEDFHVIDSVKTLITRTARRLKPSMCTIAATDIASPISVILQPRAPLRGFFCPFPDRPEPDRLGSHRHHAIWTAIAHLPATGIG